jgi:hypothetical protein
MLWLQKETGITPIIPSIRSSDFDSAMADPFGYFLRRRLGLIPFGVSAPALEYGKLLHCRFEVYDEVDVDRVNDHMRCYVDTEITNDHVHGEQFGLSNQTLNDMAEKRRTQAMTAMAWWDGASQVKLPQYGTILDFLRRDCWDILCREVEFHTPFGDTHAVIKPDLLLYHRTENALYVVDLKSCSEPTEIRVQTCPYEFQTWHYPYTLAQMIADGTLVIPNWEIPPGLKVGGMIHLIVRKPNLNIGQQDRDYHYEAVSKRKRLAGTGHPLGDGTWKFNIYKAEVEHPIEDISSFAGAMPTETHILPDEAEIIEAFADKVGVKAKKAFSADPSPVRYAQRCKNWYLAEGEQSHKAIDHEYSPPVNISITNGDLVVDPEVSAEYYTSANMIEDLATRDPLPGNFPKNFSHLRAYGRLSSYAPFYMCPLKDWPEIIRRGRFYVDHRDAVHEQVA